MEAKTLSDSGRQREALEFLHKNPKPEDPNYHFNLGTLYLRLNQPGPAVAHLEKAWHLNSHDREIADHLKRGRDALGNLIGRDRLAPAFSEVELFLERLPLPMIAFSVSVVFLISALSWIPALLKSRKLTSLLGTARGLATISSAAILLALLLTTNWLKSSPAAVCVEVETIRSGPGHLFLELARLEAGTKVKLLSQSESEGTPSGERWWQIQYGSSAVGWVRASSLFALR